MVDQEGVDDAAHLDQLLPFAVVAGEPRHLASRDRTHLAEADICHHPLEAHPLRVAVSGSSQILIDDIDLAPAEQPQPLLHPVLQFLTLQVVNHLIGRRLSHVEDGLALRVLRLDLVTHRAPPRREPSWGARGGGSGGAEPEEAALAFAHPPGVGASPAS